tara:strand:+ start:563 stop:1216 length:654 start_codon:yes stop_codon:yes gene_type:complete
MHKVITGFRQLMPKLVILIIIFILFSCSNDDIDVNQVSKESDDLKIYTPSPIPSPTPSPIPSPTPSPTSIPLIIPTPTSELIDIHLLDEEITKLKIIFDQNSIRKYTQITVPDGRILKQLILNEYIGEDKIAFYGIYETVEIWEPSEEIVPFLSAWGHIESEKFIGKNILSYSEFLELSIDQRDGNGYVTLGPGTYIMIVQNGNITNAKYEFSFILE